MKTDPEARKSRKKGGRGMEVKITYFTSKNIPKLASCSYLWTAEDPEEKRKYYPSMIC